MKNKNEQYAKSLEVLMELFGEEIEPMMPYEYINKTIADNLSNVLEAIKLIGKTINVGDKVRFKEEYKVHTGSFFVGLIDDRLSYPYVLVENIEDIGLNGSELAAKYTTDTRDYDVAKLHQIELGWINHD